MSTANPNDGFKFSRGATLQCQCGKCDRVKIIERFLDDERKPNYMVRTVTGSLLYQVSEVGFMIAGFSEVKAEAERDLLPMCCCLTRSN